MRSRPNRTEYGMGPPGFHSDRQGFTLTEIIVSLTVFSVIMAAALSFLQIQTQGFRMGLDRAAALLTVRFSLGVLEQDIQTAGTNVSGDQPEVVYAGTDMIAFNADYVTRRRNDPFAVYYDPDVETEASFSLPKNRRIVLPGTSFRYPDTTYAGGAGARSPAETLIFYFTLDTRTSRSDDYALYRQVNDGEPQLVASDILATQGHPFFRYFIENETTVDSLLNSEVPVFHSETIHGSVADTGVVALVDSIRAVRVTLTATNGKTGEEERTAVLTRIIRLPNVGFGTLESCGSPPILGGGINAAVVTMDGAPAVNLTWARATDEGGGENDVVRYVLFRRLSSEANFEEPYLSIPSGETNYIYLDLNVDPGETYVYALAAQDCTPSLSSMSSSVTVAIPS